MDFTTVIGFLLLYFIRPQEWIDLIYDWPIVKYLMILAILAMLYAHRGFRFKDYFKTPHDWFMITYVAWVIYTAKNFSMVFSEVRNLYLFYVVIVQAVNTRERLGKFAAWWAWLTFTVAALAVASEFGVDPTGAYDITHGLFMKGRLVLNTTIFNNPNALAHGTFACIPMLYYLYIWRRPVFLQEVIAIILSIPAYAIYLTQSRGGYMASLASTFISLLFGRPKILQLLFFSAMLIIIPPLMKSIRHMERPDDRGMEAGVQGRRMAFRFGLSVIRTSHFRGLGFRQFTNYSPWKIEIRSGKPYKISRIAPHSAINCIGAEQGRVGLYLWLGIWYCCLRTLLMSRCNDEANERYRRFLLATVVAFLFSAWFIDIAYRGTFFIITGAVAAFHRIVRLQLLAPESASLADRIQQSAHLPSPVTPHPNVQGPSVWVHPQPSSEMKTYHQQSATFSTFSIPSLFAKKIWNRFGIMDIGLVAIMTYVSIRIWEYLSNHM